MTRQDFLDAVRRANIRSSAFDLNGHGDECYVLSGNENHWSVYYSERGLDTKMRHFGSEAAALKHLLAVLKTDTSTKL